MAGEYHEANGVIVQIPQNPPQITCAADQPTWEGQNDARCLRNVQQFFAMGGAANFNQPHHGVNGARNLNAGAGGTAGLNIGDPFSIPTLAFQQRLGQQVGIVLNNVVVQLDTSLTGAAPAAARGKNPPANTRQFAPLNLGATPQDDGIGGVPRALVDTHATLDIGAETVDVHYFNTGNPTGFGGTMAILLDGGGRLYLAGPNIDGLFPPTYHPIVGTNPVGDTIAGFNVRNAAGWDYTVTGSQMAGAIQGLPVGSLSGCHGLRGHASAEPGRM